MNTYITRYKNNIKCIDSQAMRLTDRALFAWEHTGTVLCVHLLYIRNEPNLSVRLSGGRNRTRTCDPIDVNDVLYQLSHATKYEVGVVSTTNVIITPLRGVVKVLGEFFGRHRQRRNAGRAVQRRYHAHIRRDAIIGVRRAGGATPPLQPLSRLRRQLPLKGEPRRTAGHHQFLIPHSPTADANDGVPTVYTLTHQSATAR